MQQNYNLNTKLKIIRNMLLYLIIRSKSSDKNLTLYEIRKFLIEMYELIA